MDDWVSVCRNVVVAGVKCWDRHRKTWRMHVGDDMKFHGLRPEYALSTHPKKNFRGAPGKASPTIFLIQA